MFLNRDFARRCGIKMMHEHQNFLLDAVSKNHYQNYFFAGPRQIGKTIALLNLIYFLRDRDSIAPIILVCSHPNEGYFSQLKKDFEKMNVEVTRKLIIDEVKTPPIILIDEAGFLRGSNANLISNIILLKDEVFRSVQQYKKLIVISTPRKGSEFNLFSLLCFRGLLNNSRLFDISYEYPLYEFLPKSDKSLLNSGNYYNEEIRGLIL